MAASGVEDPAASAPGPVTLVIPVRDEVSSVGALVRSIHAQTREPEEVVFVDAGSDDGTPCAIRGLSGGDARVKVIEVGPATPGRARNVGIEAASHDWIALTDAGIELEPTWLERLVEVAGAPTAPVVVYGDYEPCTPTFFTQCAALAYVPPRHPVPGGRARGPFVASCLLRRQAWRAAGGFPDLRAAEDLIFFRRLDGIGARVAWAPDARVWWQLQPTLAATFRRFRAYSRHNVLAGQQRHWHYGVARLYLAALPFVALSITRSRVWLVAPGLGLAARAARGIWRHREGRGLRWVAHPARLPLVALILVVIDGATFLGWVDAAHWRLRSSAMDVGEAARVPGGS